MMKYFRSDTQLSNRTKRVFFIAGLIIAGLILFDIFIPHLSFGVDRAAATLWRGGDYVSDRFSASVAALFLSKQDLVTENRRLEEKLRQARIEVLNHTIVKRENEKLRTLLGQQREHSNTVVGQVLVHPHISPYDTLIVDVGGKEGVREGDVVIRGGAVLGRVQSISSHTARIQLFSSPQVKTEVQLSGKGNVQAVATGVGGGNLRITLPRGVAVQVGDPVVFAALQQYILGVVEKIESTPAESFQTIYVRIPVNIYNVQYVTILQSSEE